jgi:hypothetical protein
VGCQAEEKVGVAAVKPDEQRFLVDVYRRGLTPREIINEPGFYMHPKGHGHLGSGMQECMIGRYA